MQIKKHSKMIKRVDEMKKKNMEKKKFTAPGIPKRSPIQALTAPDVAYSGVQTRTGAFNVVWS